MFFDLTESHRTQPPPPSQGKKTPKNNLKKKPPNNYSFLISYLTSVSRSMPYHGVDIEDLDRLKF